MVATGTRYSRRSPEAKARAVAYARAWRLNNLDHAREQDKKYRFSKYGISKQEFVIMAEKQGWKCPITGAPLSMSSHVDHCHTTGKVRGILSPHGNQLLGQAKDSILVLENAIKYLSQQALAEPT
jgi:Recombination endonuclease VII